VIPREGVESEQAKVLSMKRKGYFVIPREGVESSVFEVRKATGELVP